MSSIAVSLIFFWPLAVFAIDPAEKVRVQIGSYDYSIPKAYLSPPFHEKCNQSALALDMQLPDFKPRNRDLREWKNIMHDVSNGLIRKYDKTAQEIMEITFSNRKKISQFNWVEADNDYFGLDVHIPELTESTVSKLLNGKSKQNYFFTKRINRKLETFIDCAAFGDGKNPGCRHYFVVNGVRVKFSYSLHHLYKWKENENKLREKLLSWTLGKSKENLPQCCETIECMKKQGAIKEK